MGREVATLPGFEDLMRRYRRLVYRIAYGFTRNPEAAMDVTQETFLKVHERRSEWRGDGDVKNWIARIAANEAMNFTRSERRKAVDGLHLGSPESVEPSQHTKLVRRQGEQALHRSLAALPERQRLAVVLRYFEGMSSREIAGALECSEETARNTLLRSLRKLRAALAESKGALMSACARYEAMLQARVAGELHPTDARELSAHCDACEACGDLLLLHAQLERLGDATVEPADEDFSAMTDRVLARVRAGGPQAAAWWKPAAAIAASIALFVVGLAVGRGAGRNGETGAAARLVAAMTAEAASNRGLADVEDSRFTYSNVSLRSAGPARVTLDFDVSTHVRLDEPVESELTREVLVQALLDRSSTGARLRALSFAGTSLQPKVRQAMMLSLRSDPSLAVRLKALELLADQLEQPDVEAAVLGVLRDDESVPMRLLALDSLAEHRVDRDRIRDAIHEGEPSGDEALLVRLAELPSRL